jgi:spore coat protein A, manganese oxidase
MTPPHPDTHVAVHLHGAKVEPMNDGLPMDWFAPGQSRLYSYPMDQRGTFLWFHDHGDAVTRSNVMAGLAGGLILRDPREAQLKLPAPPYEMAVVIQDRIFHADGSLSYPNLESPAGPPYDSMEFLGDVMTVNGKIWPYTTVEPRKYRLRFLNGSNARSYNLQWENGNGPLFYQIGNEGGLLPFTVSMTKLLMAPAERPDVIVDFSKYRGQNLVLYSDIESPYPSGGTLPLNSPIREILQFRVAASTVGMDKTVTPIYPDPVPGAVAGSIAKTRDFELDEQLDTYGRLIQYVTPLGTGAHPLGAGDPVTEFPVEGTNEVWRFFNTTVDMHPMHTHLFTFQAVQRRPFDVAYFQTTGLIKFTGSPVFPSYNELGWKETIMCPPGFMTVITMNFPLSANHMYTGSYVYHCHILEHEEHDMMRLFTVTPAPTPPSRPGRRIFGFSE